MYSNLLQSLHMCFRKFTGFGRTCVGAQGYL